jgi:hypothetical protein
MSVSEDAEDFVVAEWQAALADAEADDSDYHLIVCAGAAVTGHPKGVSFRRGWTLTGAGDEGGIVVEPAKIAEANAPANVSRHRVAVLEDVDAEDETEVAFLAGVLRHEIEHCTQREVAADAFDLYGLVDDVVQTVCATDESCIRDLFNAQPIEADAHAASSAYLRRRYPDAVPALLTGADKYLAQATEPPGEPEQLVRRTVDFLWQFADVCDDPASLTKGTTFAEVLDDWLPGSGEHWRALQSAD